MTPRAWFLLLTAALAAQAQQIRVAPHYLGQPLSAANANYKLFYYIGSPTSMSGGDEISPAIPNPTRSFIPGVRDTFNLRRAQDAGDGGAAFATTSLQYPQSGVLDWNPETSGLYGILKGSVRIDGNVPAAGTTRMVQERLNNYGLELITNIDAAGDFRILLWAATYNFSIRYNNTLVLTRSFTVQAGQEVDTGTILAPSTLADGLLRTEPTYLSQPVSAINADFSMEYWRGGSYRGFNFSRSVPFVSVSLTPGGYGVEARAGGVSVGVANATVVSSTTVNANPEVGGAMGIVQGAVTVNGVAPSPGGPYQADAGGVTTNLSSTAGAIRWLLRAGTYTGLVRGSAGNFHSFPFTVVAGQTTNLGTIVTTEQIGTLVVSPVYFGQALSTLGAGFWLRVAVTSSGPSGGTLNPGAPTWTGNLLVGTYPVEIRRGPSNILMQSGTATVSANNTTLYQPELSGSAGLFRGGVRIEGVPPATSYSIQMDSVVFPVTLATGDFRGLIWGGAHTPVVAGASSFSAAPVVIPNGVETDLGLLGLLSFNATITSGGGTIGGVRTWNFKLINTGPAAVNARITAVDVFNLTGSPCVAPVRQTALPVLFGSIAGSGGNATQGVAYNFLGSAGGCRYNIQLTVTDGGVRRQEIYRTNIFQ